MPSTTTAKTLLDSKEIREIYSVSPDQSTFEALQLMEKKDVGAVAVMEDGRLEGILTEREYARRIVLCGKTSRHTPVFDTMNREFPKVSPETTIEECMKIMTATRFRYVAVLKDESFVGLISIGDIVKLIIARQQADIEHLQRYITGI